MNIQWIQLGIVGKAHGMLGAFFVSRREEALPPSLKTVLVGLRPETGRKLTVKSSRMQNSRVVLLCVEISQREAVESLIGQPICIERKVLKLDEDKEYFWVDLIGKQVIDCQGLAIGKIENVGNFGASDIVLVRNEHGATLEVPFVRSYFDFSFLSTDLVIRMNVPLETFQDVWSED